MQMPFKKGEHSPAVELRLTLLDQDSDRTMTVDFESHGNGSFLDIEIQGDSFQLNADELKSLAYWSGEVCEAMDEYHGE